jgi:hypothetical protein
MVVEHHEFHILKCVVLHGFFYFFGTYVFLDTRYYSLRPNKRVARATVSCPRKTV